MSTADIILSAVALVQAAFLAAAAFSAWKTYQLAAQEHIEARAEARKAPLRELFVDVVREFKQLAFIARNQEGGGGSLRFDVVAGQQQRLSVALTFLPADVFNLFATKELTTKPANEITPNVIENASNELVRLFGDIDDGLYSVRQVALAPVLRERGF